MLRLTALLLALGILGSQGTVVDLTEAVAKQAEWNIVETRGGGPIGTWPKPASHDPVAIRLVEVFTSGKHLYFSIEIKNDRQVELEVPVSLSSRLLDNGGEVTRFRELLVQLGTVTDDAASFKPTLSIKPVSLFGSRSVAGTFRVLAPSETLTLRFKTEFQSGAHGDLNMLRAKVGGWEVELVRARGGYKQVSTLIPALFATSPPSKPNGKHTTK